jgi:hypothetical protein
MTTADEVRLILGLSTDVVSDQTLNAALTLASEWCAVRASAYHVQPPQGAIVMMTLFFLRNNLDLRGIKPSSISMPDLSMSTDLKSACDMLKDAALDEIKAAAYARGAAVKHIRSGKVPLRWH